MNDKNKKQQHPSYKRLTEEAAKFGIFCEADLAAALNSTDQQKINNWQRRGVSKDGALDAERHLGCSATWILDGQLPGNFKMQIIAAVPVVRHVILEMCALANNLDDDAVRALNSLIRKMHCK